MDKACTAASARAARDAATTRTRRRCGDLASGVLAPDRSELARPPLADDPTWLNLREAAGYLRVTPTTIYRYCERGLLPYYELPTGGGRRFKRTDLDRLLEAGRHEERATDGDK